MPGLTGGHGFPRSKVPTSDDLQEVAPVLLFSRIDVPAGKLAGVLAAGESRCCLREWLARVADPRSRLGRWHPLEFVLALAICAFTAAGPASPAAVAEWAAGCAGDAGLGGGVSRPGWPARAAAGE